MWRSAAKIAGATILFGAIHSVLASRASKRAATRLVGRRNRNGLYRPFFILQSLAMFSGLVLYARRLPDRVLYAVPQPMVIPMQAIRAASIGYAVLAARAVGIGKITGWEGLRALLHHDDFVPPEPEAQGPALACDGNMAVTGPFGTSRHPLNFSPLPVLWLEPKMTANWLAFTSVATLYFLLGSLHEEVRLREAYGDPYSAYQKSGINFFVPSITALLTGGKGPARLTIG